jgi:hypothetical protein
MKRSYAKLNLLGAFGTPSDSQRTEKIAENVMITSKINHADYWTAIAALPGFYGPARSTSQTGKATHHAHR